MYLTTMRKNNLKRKADAPQSCIVIGDAALKVQRPRVARACYYSGKQLFAIMRALSPSALIDVWLILARGGYVRSIACDAIVRRYAARA